MALERSHDVGIQGPVQIQAKLPASSCSENHPKWFHLTPRAECASKGTTSISRTVCDQMCLPYQDV